MAATTPETTIPNFPRVPLRRQSAYGAAIDFSRLDVVKYSQKMMKELTSVLTRLADLEEERDSCDYQIGYYTNLLAASRSPPSDTADEDYDDFFDDYYTRYNVSQRYKMEVYWYNTLQDEKFHMGSICAEIDYLQGIKQDLTLHMKTVYNYVKKQYNQFQQQQQQQNE
jgi:hypothetical protein